MKSVSRQIQDVQDEMQERMNWITVAMTLLNYAANHDMTDELKANMICHAKKGEME